jgi:hypothetical protein
MKIQALKDRAGLGFCHTEGIQKELFSLIYDLLEIVEAQQKEIAALKPKRSGWDIEPPPRPAYDASHLPEPPRIINLAATHRQEIESFARSQGHMPY